MKARRSVLTPLRIAVVGHFQVGKSTLINCILRKRVATPGDTTTATTSRIDEYLSRCGCLLLVDTPGVNADTGHDSIAEEVLDRVDAAIFVATSIRSLDQSLTALCKKLSNKRLPISMVINCWDNNWQDGDPENVNTKVVNSIKAQIQNRGVRLASFHAVNIEWAAAARGCLNSRATRRLMEDFAITLSDSAVELDQRSRFPELEEYLMPNPLKGFLPEGFEAANLTSKFLRRGRN